MASSQEIAPITSYTYDVFLSFRGTDTRKHFTDHLYAALKQAGFHTFRDDDELDIGQKIDAGLQKAIQESKVSVVVFSKDYASSRWCLDELVRILERVRNNGHTLLSIFYDVTPSQVGKQTGSFALSFRKHEEDFINETDKINRWRAALTDATHLKGMELLDRYQSEFIHDVIREIRDKLHPGKLDLSPILVGVDRTVDKINSWLQDEAHKASMSIIYGIGGIGKTTIAKILYNKNLERFESCSFLANVRDLSKEPTGLIRLQNQLLSNILKRKIYKVYNTDDCIVKIQNAISRKKVMIILDDVDDPDQLDALLGKREIQLYLGSKIILTTRCVLKTNRVSQKFQVNVLDEKESLQLFNWHAFRQNRPIDSYLKCSIEATEWCEGLPLALQVLGSSLFNRSIDVWEDTVGELKLFPDSKVQRILKISYDSLENDRVQNLFLHIACFFVGMEKNYVTEILKGCGFHTSVGIQNLVDRCLISVDQDNELGMHRLLSQMGREIVRQESIDDPGKRSRLWEPSDACNVLQDRTGTENIKGLVLDLHRLRESSYTCIQQPNLASSDSFTLSRTINLGTESFRKMQKLQILQLFGVNFMGDYAYIPKNLVLLGCHGFPLKCIPSNFRFEKLVSLDLSYSEIENVGTLIMPKLIYLNLSYCQRLTKMTNFAKIPHVKRLIFRGCIKLIEVDESIEYLKNLLILNLKDCTRLRRLPKNFTMLESLEEIDLSGCSNLDELPEDMREMKSLKEFHASGTAINQILSTSTINTQTNIVSLLSSIMWHPTFQSWLTLRKRSRSTNFSLAWLPSSLSCLTLENCNLYEDAFPCDLKCLGSLRRLNLSGNPFHNLAESISSHTLLEVLILDQCTGIQSLQNLPLKLKSLYVDNCSSLERIESPEVSSRLQITHVYADQCDKLVGVGNSYNIYSFNHIDKAIIKSLGFSNLESTSNIKVDMINTLTSTRRMTSLEVLHQHGIQNIFLPEDDLPNSFSFEGEGSKLYFEFFPVAGTNYKISGFNVCITYAVLQDAQQINLSKKPLSVHIDIPAREKSWWYSPICYAVPKDKKNMTWVSHWKVGDGLEVGDQVLICVHPIDSFQIKKCGISCFLVADLKSAPEVIGDLAQEPAPLDSNGLNGRYYSLHEAKRKPKDIVWCRAHHRNSPNERIL